MSSKWQICVGAAAVVFGIVFSQVLPGQVPAKADSNKKNQALIESIKQLETNISGLEDELSSLRDDIDDLQNGESGERNISRNMQIDIQLQQTTAGLTELSGEGIIITLDDNSAGASAAKANDPANYRPNDYIIHDKNLLYLVNELKAAGAQGITINNQRIAAGSDIRCVGTVIMVNSTRVAPPFEILAIGNARKLKEAIEKGREYHYLQENKYPVKVETAEEIKLPGYSGSFSPKYMSSADSELDE